MQNSQLPEKLSELIRLSVSDAKKCEVNPHFVLDMRSWLLYRSADDKCLICMAGAVMAQTLGDSQYVMRMPRDYSSEVRDKLYAINYARIGTLHDAFGSLGLPPAPDIVDALNAKISKSFVLELGRARANRAALYPADRGVTR